MGTTAEKLTYLNTTKQLIKESINLTDANITTQPFRQYATILKHRLPEIVGDPSIIWNNYEHVTGTGTSFSITAYNSIIEYQLKGNTTQTGTPTPDAPVPVNVVTGDQIVSVSDGTNTQSFEINLGKNLFDKNNVRIGYRFDSDGNYYANTGYNATEYIEVQPSTLYSVSWTMAWDECVCTYDINKNFVRRIISGTNFTTSASEYYIRADVSNAHLSTAQIEKGSTATTYAPYFTPIELCKIGTYQDYIYKDSGNWYLHKEIGKVVLDGTQNIPLASGTPRRFNATYTALGIDNVKSGSTALETQNNYRMCDHFAYTSGVNTWGMYYLHNNWLVMLDGESVIASANDLKNWLASNPTTIYYVLANPTTEEIKNYELFNQLNALSLYTGTNTITVTSNDLPATLDLTAIKYE